MLRIVQVFWLHTAAGELRRHTNSDSDLRCTCGRSVRDHSDSKCLDWQHVIQLRRVGLFWRFDEMTGAWQTIPRVLATKVANGDKYADSDHIGDVSWLPKRVAFD
jgi:hypothetical protein